MGLEFLLSDFLNTNLNFWSFQVTEGSPGVLLSTGHEDFKVVVYGIPHKFLYCRLLIQSIARKLVS